jgi:hypothetical protein
VNVGTLSGGNITNTILNNSTLSGTTVNVGTISGGVIRATQLGNDSTPWTVTMAPDADITVGHVLTLATADIMTGLGTATWQVGGAGGPATSLATPGSPVVVNVSPAPTGAGQYLRTTTATNAAWTTVAPGSIVWTNTWFVDAGSGVNATAVKGDPTLPAADFNYSTWSSVPISGDSIYVRKGNYTLAAADNLLLAAKTLYYYFEQNAVLTKTAAGGIIDDTGFASPATINIAGHGVFQGDNGVIILTSAQTITLYAEAQTMTHAGTSNAHIVQNNNSSASTTVEVHVWQNITQGHTANECIHVSATSPAVVTADTLVNTSQGGVIVITGTPPFVNIKARSATSTGGVIADITPTISTVVNLDLTTCLINNSGVLVPRAINVERGLVNFTCDTLFNNSVSGGVTCAIRVDAAAGGVGTSVVQAKFNRLFTESGTCLISNNFGRLEIDGGALEIGASSTVIINLNTDGELTGKIRAMINAAACLGIQDFGGMRLHLIIQDDIPTNCSLQVTSDDVNLKCGNVTTPSALNISNATAGGERLLSAAFAKR